MTAAQPRSLGSGGVAVSALGMGCWAIGGPHSRQGNIFSGNADTLKVCEENGLASIVRGPLGMGLLTGKFSADSALPADDVRHGWDFRSGSQAESLRRLDAVRDILTSGGRTLAQGALGWLWARSEAFVPIPGFKSVAQVEDNAGAIAHGPLSTEHMQQIADVLA